MTKLCDITGRVGRMGYNLSHAHNRTKRRFDINIQSNTFFSDSGARVRLRVTPKGLRTVEKKGGIDAFVLSAKESTLHPKLKSLKKTLLHKQGT